MTYELAKQLKDAGFPQECADIKRFFPILDRGTRGLERNDVLDPTLSELIAAVRRDAYVGVFRLELNVTPDGMPRFRAVVIQRIDGVNPNSGDRTGIDFAVGGYPIGYDTPEEAVARLWLAINGKEQGHGS